jgi:hypothetical protein
VPRRSRTPSGSAPSRMSINFSERSALWMDTGIRTARARARPPTRRALSSRTCAMIRASSPRTTPRISSTSNTRRCRRRCMARRTHTGGAHPLVERAARTSPVRPCGTATRPGLLRGSVRLRSREGTWSWPTSTTATRAHERVRLRMGDAVFSGNYESASSWRDQPFEYRKPGSPSKPSVVTESPRKSSLSGTLPPSRTRTIRATSRGACTRVPQ